MNDKDLDRSLDLRELREANFSHSNNKSSGPDIYNSGSIQTFNELSINEEYAMLWGEIL